MSSSGKGSGLVYITYSIRGILIGGAIVAVRQRANETEYDELQNRPHELIAGPGLKRMGPLTRPASGLCPVPQQ